MATLFYRLGKTAYRRWPLFIAAWLIAMVAVGTFAATMARLSTLIITPTLFDINDEDNTDPQITMTVTDAPSRVLLRAARPACQGTVAIASDNGRSHKSPLGEGMSNGWAGGQLRRPSASGKRGWVRASPR